MSRKKHTFEYVRKYYDDRDYTYLSTTYTNNKTKEPVRCPEGHQYEVGFSDFKNGGNRCAVCVGVKKNTIEYVKKYFKDRDYLYLSTTYTNNKKKELVQCPEGHQYEVRFNDFKNSRRCPKCANEIRSEKQKHTIEDVKKYYENEGYKYLSTTYTNNRTKELVQCPEGHQYEVSFGNFQSDYRCPVCSIKIGSEKRKHTIEDVRKYYENEGYKYLSTKYTNSKTKELVQCPEGHQYEVRFNNFQNGQRCPVCNNEKTSSKAEIELQEFVKTITKVICNDRTQIVNTNTGHYLELDIYLPDLKKAIEYNGVFWHSSKEAKMKDKMKVDQCKNLGIDLLVINEADYIGNEEKVKNEIREWLLE